MSAIDPELARLGWDDAREAESARVDGVIGRVGRVDRGWITVLTGGGETLRARGALLGRHRDPMQRPAVGDWVVVRGDELAEVLPRRSALVRGVTEGRAEASAGQLVATNVDRVLIVHAIDAPLRARRLERELVVVHESGAEPVVVLSKADLVDDVDARVDAVRVVVGAVSLHAVSARTGAGVTALGALLEPGRTVALIGPSGAGKSTIINALVGEELLPTGEVRASDRRGRHTTVARDLVLLDSGAIVVDTPGLRSVGLWDADEGLEEAFADIEALAKDCRFADCAHRSEPGCAVRDAVERGELEGARVDAYVHLDEELDRLADREVERERDARRRANQRPRPS